MFFKRFREDLRSIRARDPAARSSVEVFLLYPGVHAVIWHRLAHGLYRCRLLFLARLVSQWGRFWTGIEIHPGAKIGRALFIDHGAGVVIGETAELGDHVTLYQGVTLGGTGKESGKRHPTIGDHVMISSGAKVLGSFTVGEHAKVAAGAVVLGEVPPYATAVGVPARVVKVGSKKVEPPQELDQVHIPDPVALELCKMQVQIAQMEARLAAITQPEE